MCFIARTPPRSVECTGPNKVYYEPNTQALLREQILVRFEWLDLALKVAKVTYQILITLKLGLSPDYKNITSWTLAKGIY